MQGLSSRNVPFKRGCEMLGLRREPDEKLKPGLLVNKTKLIFGAVTITVFLFVVCLTIIYLSSQNAKNISEIQASIYYDTETTTISDSQNNGTLESSTEALKYFVKPHQRRSKSVTNILPWHRPTQSSNDGYAQMESHRNGKRVHSVSDILRYMHGERYKPIKLSGTWVKTPNMEVMNQVKPPYHYDNLQKFKPTHPSEINLLATQQTYPHGPRFSNNVNNRPTIGPFKPLPEYPSHTQAIFHPYSNEDLGREDKEYSNHKLKPIGSQEIEEESKPHSTSDHVLHEQATYHHELPNRHYDQASHHYEQPHLGHDERLHYHREQSSPPVKPFSVLLDIYPVGLTTPTPERIRTLRGNKAIPLQVNVPSLSQIHIKPSRQHESQIISHSESHTASPSTPQRMLLHLNLYPRKKKDRKNSQAKHNMNSEQVVPMFENDFKQPEKYYDLYDDMDMESKNAAMQQALFVASDMSNSTATRRISGWCNHHEEDLTKEQNKFFVMILRSFCRNNDSDDETKIEAKDFNNHHDNGIYAKLTQLQIERENSTKFLVQDEEKKTGSSEEIGDDTRGTKQDYTEDKVIFMTRIVKEDARNNSEVNPTQYPLPNLATSNEVPPPNATQSMTDHSKELNNS